MIKDSGDRTEFETGAKRDMHAGKGRMDLLPWYGIMEVSKHCEEGALKYGEHNVDKGIPLHSLLDSASRHLAKYMVGSGATGWRFMQLVHSTDIQGRFFSAFSCLTENLSSNSGWVMRWLRAHSRFQQAARRWSSSSMPRSYNADGVSIYKKFLRCPFCKADEVHRYIGDLDGYADPDETLVAVKCGGCNAYFEIPTSNWNSMKECTTHNGEVLARCPRCGKDTFISEVSADE